MIACPINANFLIYITMLWLYKKYFHFFHKNIWKHLDVKGKHTCTYSQFKMGVGGW